MHTIRINVLVNLTRSNDRLITSATIEVNKGTNKVELSLFDCTRVLYCHFEVNCEAIDLREIDTIVLYYIVRY